MQIQRLSDACGALAWISGQLYTRQTTLAARTDVIGWKMHLARCARLHFEHAGWWRGALPTSPALAATARVRAPSPTWDELMARLAVAEVPQSLALLYEAALPALVETVTGTADRLSTVGGAALRRTARFVLLDLGEEHDAAAALRRREELSVALDEQDVPLAEGLMAEAREKNWPQPV